MDEQTARKQYHSDLTDEQWKSSNRAAKAKGGGGRASRTSEVLNAIFYLLRTGCAWRLLPTIFLRGDGLRLLSNVVTRWNTSADSRYPRDGFALLRAREEPSAACIDSQSAKQTNKGGRWIRCWQEDHGRKRHILVAGVTDE